MRVGAGGASSFGGAFDAAPFMESIGVAGGTDIDGVECPSDDRRRTVPFDTRLSDGCKTGSPVLTSPPILLMSFCPRGEDSETTELDL